MSKQSHTSDKRSRSTLKLHSSSKSLQKRRSQNSDPCPPEKIVKELLDDVVENALRIIHERYMENQTIKFVVHCAHQALMKALRIHFYQHNDYARTPLRWGSVYRTEPSSPDSWAMKQVPLHKNIKDEQELNTLSKIKLDMASEEKFLVDRAADAITVVSEPSESLLEDIGAILDDMIANLPLQSEEEKEKSISTISAFSTVVEGRLHYNAYKMKPQISKLSLGSSAVLKLPKIDLPESGSSKKDQSFTDLGGDVDKLPPIRTDAKYKCHSQQEEKTKKGRPKRIRD